MTSHSKASGLLDRIVQTKREEVELLRSSGIGESSPELRISTGDSANASPPPSFLQAVRRPPGSPLRVIAECKKASPSRGLIRPDYDPLSIAKEYAACGASALSVLTDRLYFQGDISHVPLAAKSGLPILRKDFIISPLQIQEAARYGASAVLLIVRLLSDSQLAELLSFASGLGLDVLVETHNPPEIDRALQAGAKIIGINHRDLDTLEMDLSLTERYAPAIRNSHPHVVLVAESGVESPEGRRRVEPHVDAVLIGHAFMESTDIAATWKRLFRD